MEAKERRKNNEMENSASRKIHCDETQSDLRFHEEEEISIYQIRVLQATSFRFFFSVLLLLFLIERQNWAGLSALLLIGFSREH